MFSNTKRAVTLTLLASAANMAFAAPAPVSDLSSEATTITSNTNLSVSAPTTASNETDVERLERLLQNRNRVQLQMQQQIDAMELEISELRGELERNSHDMKQMLERQRELFIELDRIRTDMKKAPVQTASTDTDADQGTFSTNVNEQTAYQNAVDLILKKRDYAGAIAAFKQFQVDYPDSSFTPNSHYWLGQLYFAKKQDGEAKKSFTAVVSFATSNKRADALLKLGDIANRNQDWPEAKRFYQQVVDEYPDSTSAKVAKKKLK